MLTTKIAWSYPSSQCIQFISFEIHKKHQHHFSLFFPSYLGYFVQTHSLLFCSDINYNIHVCAWWNSWRPFIIVLRMISVVGNKLQNMIFDVLRIVTMSRHDIWWRQVTYILTHYHINLKIITHYNCIPGIFLDMIVLFWPERANRSMKELL